MSQKTPIPFEQVPERLRLIATDLQQVSDAIVYYGGFGPVSALGQVLRDETARGLLRLASHLEQAQGGAAHG